MPLSYIPAVRSKREVIEAIELAQQEDSSPTHRLALVMLSALNPKVFTESFESFTADNFFDAVAKFTMRRYRYLVDFMSANGQITQEEYDQWVTEFMKVEDALLDAFADHLEEGGGSAIFDLKKGTMEDILPL